MFYPQKQLGATQSKFQQRIQEREKELQDLRQAVQSLKLSAQAAVEDSERIFTELIRSIERRCSEEIAELRRRDAELEQLSHTEDHIHFLQSCQTLCAPPGPEDLPSITVRPHDSFEAVRKSISELKERLEDVFKSELIKVSGKDVGKTKAGPRQSSFLVKDTAGNILSTEADWIHRWREHFSQLLNHPLVPEDPTLTETANASSDLNPDCSTSPITTTEVKAALGKLKNSKAPGMCNITAEMLKAGGDPMIQWLTQIINHVWVLERLPGDWRCGIILPFWKRKGKLFTRILLTRAMPAIRGKRRPQQAGFMPNQSTTDDISALCLAIENAREFRRDRHLYIAFIDLRAAFDTVNHVSFWKILKTL
ncbi:hypothetical protein GJAV_G00086710 [Gymnothorax javanicus]|nr:hypothetical protein GJAV_G00086710 [Gymnothorax javanicus]